MPTVETGMIFIQCEFLKHILEWKKSSMFQFLSWNGQLGLFLRVRIFREETYQISFYEFAS